MPLTADGDTNHGLNVSLSVMDEMHTWKQKQGALLYEAIITSGSTRESPLNIIITTADFARDSMCNAKFMHGKNILRGKIDDPTFLPVLYYLEPDEDWTDPENWAKCNPQLGLSINPEFYDKEVIKAKNDPTYTNSFKRLYMNIQTQSESKFLDYAKWMDCQEEIDLTGQRCYGGLDLAYKNDMCAFVLEFPFAGKYHVVTRLWLPDQHPNIQFYRDKGWIDSGDITLTDGNAIDFKQVREDIISLCRKYAPEEIGFDPRYASELCQNLYNQEGLPMVEVSQSPRILSEPLKDIAVSIVGDKFRHDGNQCAGWQIGNASSKELENGLIKLVKPQGKDATLLKVDFVAALSMAHHRMLFNDSGDFNDLMRLHKEKGYSLI
jgi:phage terminase large subunit-like protein